MCVDVYMCVCVLSMCTYKGVKLGELDVAADQALSGGAQLHGHGAVWECIRVGDDEYIYSVDHFLFFLERIERGEECSGGSKACSGAPRLHQPQ